MTVLLLTAAVIVGASLAVFIWAVTRAEDEPHEDATKVEALEGVGDDADAVVFEFPKPFRRNGGGWIA